MVSRLYVKDGDLPAVQDYLFAHLGLHADAAILPNGDAVVLIFSKSPLTHGDLTRVPKAVRLPHPHHPAPIGDVVAKAAGATATMTPADLFAKLYAVNPHPILDGHLG